MKNCLHCVRAMSPRSNSQLFCSLQCRESFPNTKAKRAEAQLRYFDNIASIHKGGKIECKICGKFYKKPMSHVFQRHQMTASEYKAHFGLMRKGICAESTKEKLVEAIAKNFDTVVAQNLIKSGEPTRFIEGVPNNYERREEHQRLLVKKWKK